MIAKITVGANAEGLGRYLHGPGTATKHTIPGTDRPGGMVVAASAAMPSIQPGSTEHRGWARRLQQQADLRPKTKDSIWHCSLNLAPEDRSLTPAEWQAAAVEFMDEMGAGERHWVAVQHDDRGIHIALARPQEGQARMWSRHQDHRRAQGARRSIEEMFDLSRTRKRKGPAASDVEQEIKAKEDELRAGARAMQPGPLGVQAAGFNWQVRARRDGRCYVWRESTDRPGIWTLLKDGIRALARALIGFGSGGGTPPILSPSAGLGTDPLQGPPAPPPSAGYDPNPGRGPGR